jgi:hypothetical protein
MSSIIEGYNYDVSISYRQKDCKYDGWVTEFVNNLKGINLADKALESEPDYLRYLTVLSATLVPAACNTTPVTHNNSRTISTTEAAAFSRRRQMVRVSGHPSQLSGLRVMSNGLGIKPQASSRIQRSSGIKQSICRLHSNSDSILCAGNRTQKPLGTTSLS